MPRIVIVGGGFAGSDLARRLHGKLPAGWEVHIYSAENHVVFTPLLPEVVGAAIDPLHVVWPIRTMVPGVTCRTAEVRAFDFGARRIEYVGPLGEVLHDHYDQLVLCCGLDVNLDIVPGMAVHGWPLKTLGDALALRNHVIQQLERAEVEPDAGRRALLLSFAVVGGGFTGVEVAGALRDVLRESVRHYSRFGLRDIRVTILDGGPRILGPLPEPLAVYAHGELVRSGVEIRTNVHVQRVHADGVDLAGDEKLAAGTVIASVGNKVGPMLASSGLVLEKGRVVVDGTMRVAGVEGVWALGDCAAVPNAHDGKISPTLGQFAVRQSLQLAANLQAISRGGAPRPFSYHARGMFAALGHRKAVGNPFGVRVTGLFAWLMWRGLYWSKMPSIARRIQIAVDWTWDLMFRRDLVEISTVQTPRRAAEVDPGKTP
jgi:NADH dehydrogenase